MYILCVFLRSNMTVSPFDDTCDKDKLESSCRTGSTE